MLEGNLEDIVFVQQVPVPKCVKNAEWGIYMKLYSLCFQGRGIPLVLFEPAMFILFWGWLVVSSGSSWWTSQVEAGSIPQLCIFTARL